MPAHLNAQLMQSVIENKDIGLLVELLERCIAQNDQILREHEQLKASLMSHTLNEESIIAGFKRAFPKKPDGSPDFDGHEAYHSTLIIESRARTEFYRELRLDLAKKGLWGLLMIAVALVSYWWTGQLRPPP